MAGVAARLILPRDLTRGRRGHECKQPHQVHGGRRYCEDEECKKDQRRQKPRDIFHVTAHKLGAMITAGRDGPVFFWRKLQVPLTIEGLADLQWLAGYRRRCAARPTGENTQWPSRAW